MYDKDLAAQGYVANYRTWIAGRVRLRGVALVPGRILPGPRRTQGSDVPATSPGAR
jgi:hypothetical protein